MAFFTAKVPVTIATGVICLLVGGGLGAAIVSYAAEAKPAAAEGGGGGGEEGKADGKGKGAPPGGIGDGKKDKKDAKKGESSRSRAQLAQLVGKLDKLTSQSLHIDLTPEQKKQVKELLADLSAKDAITEDEATAKLAALVKLLEPYKKTLADAGFPSPTARGDPPPNPFKEGEGADRLKALQATLEK